MPCRLLAEQNLQHGAAALQLEDLQQLMQASEQELQELEADLQAEVCLAGPVELLHNMATQLHSQRRCGCL